MPISSIVLGTRGPFIIAVYSLLPRRSFIHSHNHSLTRSVSHSVRGAQQKALSHLHALELIPIYRAYLSDASCLQALPPR